MPLPVLVPMKTSFPSAKALKLFTWLTVSASKLNLSQISFSSVAMPPGGLLKLRHLDSRHRQPIGIALLYVCWRV
jgi:hypothetical protein